MSLHEPILPINAESDSEGGVRLIVRELYEFLKTYPFLDLSSLKKLLGADAADAASDEDNDKNKTEEPVMTEHTEEAKELAVTPETEPAAENNADAALSQTPAEESSKRSFSRKTRPKKKAERSRRERGSLALRNRSALRNARACSRKGPRA